MDISPIADAADDMLKVSGIWVSPFEVEAASLPTKRYSKPRWWVRRR